MNVLFHTLGFYVVFEAHLLPIHLVKNVLILESDVGECSPVFFFSL